MEIFIAAAIAVVCVMIYMFFAPNSEKFFDQFRKDKNEEKR